MAQLGWMNELTQRGGLFCSSPLRQPVPPHLPPTRPPVGRGRTVCAGTLSRDEASPLEGEREQARESVKCKRGRKEGKEKKSQQTRPP